MRGSPPKKAATPAIALTAAQAALVNKVAGMMAETDGLIVAALFASYRGAFSTWLEENKELFAVVKAFHRNFYPLLVDAENFRRVAMLRRQDSGDPTAGTASASTASSSSTAAASGSGAAAGAGSASELSSFQNIRWEELDERARKRKWLNFFGQLSSSGNLRYQAALDFLVANMHRLAAVKSTWESYKPSLKMLEMKAAARALEPVLSGDTAPALSQDSGVSAGAGVGRKHSRAEFEGRKSSLAADTQQDFDADVGEELGKPGDDAGEDSTSTRSAMGAGVGISAAAQGGRLARSRSGVFGAPALLAGLVRAERTDLLASASSSTAAAALPEARGAGVTRTQSLAFSSGFRGAILGELATDDSAAGSAVAAAGVPRAQGATVVRSRAIGLSSVSMFPVAVSAGVGGSASEHADIAGADDAADQAPKAKKPRT